MSGDFSRSSRNISRISRNSISRSSISRNSITLPVPPPLLPSRADERLRLPRDERVVDQFLPVLNVLTSI